MQGLMKISHNKIVQCSLLTNSFTAILLIIVLYVKIKCKKYIAYMWFPFYTILLHENNI